MNFKKTILAAGICLFAGMAFADATSEIPARPEKLAFKPLDFTPPKPSEFRRVLKNGTPVYLAQSKEFPLVTITFSFKGGSFLEPDGKWGLAGLTGQMMRRGGTTTKKATDVDEELDFLAANCSTGIGGTSASASINTLTSNLDQSFALFLDIVRNPGFQQDKFDILKAETIEGMKQRNDDADTISRREGQALMYGRDHFEGRVATKAMIESITVDDMKAFHNRIFHPNNLIIGVVGDFEEGPMMARLERALEGWATGETIPDPPAPTATLKPGVYHIEKDIPQGKFMIGYRGLKRDDPDAVAVEIMNDVLGGSGFTSRIMNRVRTEEGLAYSAGSVFRNKVYYPGDFTAFFQSKNETCALATKIIFEEFAKIRNEKVGVEELDVAKNAAIETFPQNFQNKAGTINTFINDEWTKRPADFWQTYRDRVKALTPDDIQRVAQTYIKPENMAVFVVGKWEPIAKGDLKGRATMKDVFNGEVNHMPLHDPLTDQPLPQDPTPSTDPKKPEPTR